MIDDAEQTASWQGGEEPLLGKVWRLPEAGETLASRFRLLRVLGAGGSGVVFEAEDQELRLRVAVKIIHAHLAEPRTLERLRREVRVARGGHAHAVAVWDLHESGGWRFLSMELVEGTSLKEVLAAKGRLEVSEVIAIGRQAAEALAFFHGRGLVHRDIKPSNILVTWGEGEVGGEVGAPTVKLCDMGLVRSLEEGVTVTESAMVVGTPAYMAPEQAMGAELTPASDVYALGLVLWECLVGEAPLKGDTAVATLVKRQSSPPPRLRSLRPDAPAGLARLLAAMLDPRPRGRPSAAEVVRCLASGRVPRRVPWRQVAASVAIVLMGGAGWAGWRAVVRGATVRVEAVERAVVGYDRRGRATWQHSLENPVQQVVRADLDGDGDEEVLVSAFPAAGSEGRTDLLPFAEFLIVTRSGGVMTRIRPEQLIHFWSHPFPLRLVVASSLLDVDGDGFPEVLLNARQRSFFPNPVLLYWPRYGVWDWVLDHSGHLHDLVAIPGRAGQIAVLGINNRLCMLPVVGVWSVQPPPQRRREGAALSGTLPSPENELTATPISRWLLYVPLAAELWSRRGDGVSSIVPAAGGGFEVKMNGNIVHLDRFGNPEGSPNWGRDVRAERQEFLIRTGALRTANWLGTAALVEQEVSRLRVEMAALLAEPPYRAILALAAARSFARSGAVNQARAALLPEVGNEDVAFRLTNLEALDGELDGAAARAWRLVEGGRSPRAGFDAARLLLDVAVETHDSVELDRVIRNWVRLITVTEEMHKGVVPEWWARARLWWDQATESDGQVRSWPFADEGEAVACLVRWRLGHSTPTDAAAMEHYIRGGYEGAPLGRAALAAAHLASGASGEALHILDSLVNELQPDAAWDLRTRQFQDLARALRAHALAAVGRPEQARAEAERLLATRRADLLPGILARELLERL